MPIFIDVLTAKGGTPRRHAESTRLPWRSNDARRYGDASSSRNPLRTEPFSRNFSKDAALRCSQIPFFVAERIGIIHALLEVASRSEAGCKEKAMRAAATVQLDPTIPSNDTRDFHSAMRAKIVGQDEGMQALVNLYQVFCAGLNSPGRPVGNLLFLGPTGSGKTRIVEAAAEILFAFFDGDGGQRPRCATLSAAGIQYTKDF